METITLSHIHLDAGGVAWIDDTNVKVIEVVLDKLAHQSTPEEMHYQYPHLSLAQIHAALAYYYDHQAEFDGQIEQDRCEIREGAAQAGATPFQKRMRTAGKLT